MFTNNNIVSIDAGTSDRRRKHTHEYPKSKQLANRKDANTESSFKLPMPVCRKIYFDRSNKSMELMGIEQLLGKNKDQNCTFYEQKFETYKFDRHSSLTFQANPSFSHDTYSTLNFKEKSQKLDVYLPRASIDTGMNARSRTETDREKTETLSPYLTRTSPDSDFQSENYTKTKTFLFLKSNNLKKFKYLRFLKSLRFSTNTEFHQKKGNASKRLQIKKKLIKTSCSRV
jgi:hypothetical protein